LVAVLVWLVGWSVGLTGLVGMDGMGIGSGMGIGICIDTNQPTEQPHQQANKYVQEY